MCSAFIGGMDDRSASLNQKHGFHAVFPLFSLFVFLLCFIVSCGGSGSSDSRFGKDLLGQSACGLSATEVETTMTYDTYGNLISVTNGRKVGGSSSLSVGGKQFRESIGLRESGDGGTAVFSQEVTMVVTDYLGNEGYFPHTVTSGVGATSKRCVRGQACTQSIATFDLGLGVLLTSTDSNGAVSRSEYDGLGRLLRSYLPGDSDPSIEITDYALTANPPYVRTVIKVNDTQELITRSYVDGLGRSLGSVSGAGSDFIFSGYTRANNAGQALVAYQAISRTNESFLSSLPPSSGCSTTSFSGAYCSEFSYEDGHVSKVKHPGGATTKTYVGEDYGISTDENGIQTFAQVDALGRTLNVQTDFGNPGSQTHTVVEHVYDGLSRGFKWTHKTTAPRNLVTESFVDAKGQTRGISAPDGGEVKYNGFKTWYDFDPDGNLIYVFSGSDVIQTQYDALNRPTIVSVSRNGGGFEKESENIYDEHDEGLSSFNQGRLTTAKSFGEHRLEVEFGYDIQGRVEFQKYSDPNLSLFNPTLALKLLKFDYDYNRSGALTNITDPRGYSVAYNYDVFGRLKALNSNPQTAEEAALSYNGKSIVGDVIYDQAGRIEEIHYGHDVKDVFEFDPLGRVKEINGTSPIAGSSYTYTPNGNLDTAMESDGTSQNFLYDNLNRLTLASSQSQDPELSYQISYGYDSSGNLTSLSGMDPTGSVDQAPLRTYSTNSNRLLSTVENRTTNVFYDQHGNITQYIVGNTSRLIEYDGLGRLQELKGPNGTVKVTYGPSGKIARKRPNGSHEIYLEGAGGLLTFDQEKDLWKTHISALGRVIATMDHEENIDFHHANRLSSTAAVTYVDDSFKIQTKSETLYLPFGEELKNLGDPSTLEKFAFTNQEHDQDMKLYDYNARYYDSVLRRFLQPDSILDTTGTSQGQNRYAYVLDNPLRYNDPTGNTQQSAEEFLNGINWNQVDNGTYTYEELQATQGIGNTSNNQKDNDDQKQLGQSDIKERTFKIRGKGYDNKVWNLIFYNTSESLTVGEAKKFEEKIGKIIDVIIASNPRYWSTLLPLYKGKGDITLWIDYQNGTPNKVVMDGNVVKISPTITAPFVNLGRLLIDGIMLFRFGEIFQKGGVDDMRQHLRNQALPNLSKFDFQPIYRDYNFPESNLFIRTRNSMSSKRKAPTLSSDELKELKSQILQNQK